MNLKEAYSILEIPQTATPEEAKKKYRELTKKFHPDISKEAGAEDKFKKINEAYQVVSSGKSTDREEVHSSIYDPFGMNRQQIIVENIIIHTTISFKESIIGCQKELKFNRNIKCTNCNGQGESPVNNGCDKCGGRGKIIGKHENTIFFRDCDKCYGRVNVTPCKSCNSSGVLSSSTSISVNVPGGRNNGDILRLNGMGNYAGSFGPFEQYTDAHLHINVLSDPDLILDGRNVKMKLTISLLEALQGCKKTVRTIDGNKEIDIKPLSKNKEEVIIPKLGVNYLGNQIVVLDVQYPSNIDKIINLLDGKEV